MRSQIETTVIPAVTAEVGEELRTSLCAWFGRVRRDLPWRRTSDPYAIWISEAMLQQTRVETVIPYWTRFLKALPTVAELAQVDEERLLGLWSGLGYYRRARSLQAAAIMIETKFDGQFPDLLEDVLALPGIGPYTAGAILSIAFDHPVAAVDGNVLRVFSRLFEIDEAWGSAKLNRVVWQLAEELMVMGQATPRDASDGPGAWNQGLMELGATVCTAKNPSCGDCPWSSRCAAFERGTVARYPIPGAKKTYVSVELETLVILRGTSILVRRRPSDGRMAGLLECPTREVLPTEREDGETRLFDADFGLPMERTSAESRIEVAEIRHSITNHRIRAKIYAQKLTDSTDFPVDSPWRWMAMDELESGALTGMTSKLLKQFDVINFVSESAER
ncbi:MAG: A/G-specific adenine glycosylase [Planctomycetota bacterium]|jgi:A/G-specific adenine glycosylase